MSHRCPRTGAHNIDHTDQELALTLVHCCQTSCHHSRGSMEHTTAKTDLQSIAPRPPNHRHLLFTSHQKPKSGMVRTTQRNDKLKYLNQHSTVVIVGSVGQNGLPYTPTSELCFFCVLCTSTSMGLAVISKASLWPIGCDSTDGSKDTYSDDSHASPAPVALSVASIALNEEEGICILAIHT